MFSGAVEPLSALVAISLAGLAVPILPYLLSFAAGAMMYVVVEELIPEMSEGNHWNIGALCFSVGFYIQWQSRRTDRFVDKLYTLKGYFTPPYETLESLQKRLG